VQARSSSPTVRPRQRRGASPSHTRRRPRPCSSSYVAHGHPTVSTCLLSVVSVELRLARHRGSLVDARCVDSPVIAEAFLGGPAQFGGFFFFLLFSFCNIFDDEIKHVQIQKFLMKDCLDFVARFTICPNLKKHKFGNLFKFKIYLNSKSVHIQICSNSNLFKFEFVQIRICSRSNLFKFEFVQVQICSNSNLFKFEFVLVQICSNSNLFTLKFVQIQICSRSYLFKFKFVHIRISAG
jgi:hypothetical protein